MSSNFAARLPYVKKGGSEPAQRVIIPQGLISAHKTTIIEIPENLQNLPTVIATAKNASASQFTNSVSSQDHPRRTRTIIETKKYVEEIPDDNLADDINLDRAKEEFCPRAHTNNNSHLQNDGAAYGGMGFDCSSHLPGSFHKNYMPGYTAIVESEESGDCVADSSRYDNFSPIADSTGLGSYLPRYATYDNFASTPKGNVQSTESYLNARDYCFDQPHPDVCLAQATSICSQHGDDADAGLKRILDELDHKELQEMQQNLKNVQTARRKLIYNASNIKH